MHAMHTWPGPARAARGYGWLLALAVLLASATGCVTSGKYQEMVAERDALEQKVSALEEVNREFDAQLEERSAMVTEMAITMLLNTPLRNTRAVAAPILAVSPGGLGNR